MSDNVKQVIILRKDLNMRKGKMVAQGAHASMAVFLNRGSDNGAGFCFNLTDDMREWLEGRFTKICLGVDSLDALLSIHDKAMLQGLPCSLITDAGLTEFNGEPTMTAIAIGPADSKKIDLITGNLKLL